MAIADRRLPQFALPVSIPASVVTVTYASHPPVAYNISAATRYNARSTDASLDVLAYVLGIIQAVDTGSTSWTPGNLASSYTGIATIVNVRAGGDARGAATSLEFTSGLTGADLGFTSNTVAASPNGTFTATYRRKYFWTPDPDGVPLLVLDEPRALTSNVRTTAPGGTTTIDFYGSMKEREVIIARMDAANVYSHYSSDSGYAGAIASTLNTADPNAAFEGLVSQWAATSAASVRYWPDRSDLTTYVDLAPPEQGGEWLGDLTQAFTESSPRPHRFDANLRFVEV